MDTTNEKLIEINKSFDELKSHYTYPTTFLYDYFKEIKNEIDLGAEKTLLKFELESSSEISISTKRMFLIEIIEGVHIECGKRCPNDSLKDIHLSHDISIAIQQIDSKLSSLKEDDQDLFNDSMMEDQLIGMLTDDTINGLNQSVTSLKQKSLDKKLNEIEILIEDADDKLKKYLLMNQSWIFLDNTECEKYLNKGYLKYQTNCLQQAIREVIFSSNVENKMQCSCSNCNTNAAANLYYNLGAYDYNPIDYPYYGYEYEDYEDEYHDYVMQNALDEQESMDSEEEDEDYTGEVDNPEEDNEHDESLDEAEEKEENAKEAEEEIEVDNNDIILIEEVKPEDLFFGLLFQLDQYVSSKKIFLHRIQMFIGNESIGSLTNTKLKTYFFLKELRNKIESLKSLKQTIIVELNMKKTLKTLSISGSQCTSLNSNLFNSFEDLESLQISGKTADFIFNDKCLNGCTNLTFIDFSYCSLKSINMNMFENLPKLGSLNLSNNLINDIIHVLNDNALIYLTKLDLSNNKLDCIKSNYFNNFVKLTELKLKSNLIDSIDKSNCFDKCKQLKEIDMSKNRLKSFDMKHFSALTNMTHLNLSNNSLNEIRNSEDKNVPLIELFLEDNKFVHIKSSFFSRLINLQKLHLKNNSIEIIDKKAFDTLKSLRHLDLSNNSIDKLNDFTFSLNENLLCLNLSKNCFKVIKSTYFMVNPKNKLNQLILCLNQIAQIEPHSFDTLHSLTSLDLSENQLESITPFLFYKLKSLQTLDLSKNKLKVVKSNYFPILNSQLIKLDLSFNQIERFEPNSFTYLMGMNTDDPRLISKCTTMGNLQKVLLYGNKVESVHHSDNDRKRNCFIRFFTSDCKPATK